MEDSAYDAFSMFLPHSLGLIEQIYFAKGLTWLLSRTIYLKQCVEMNFWCMENPGGHE